MHNFIFRINTTEYSDDLSRCVKELLKYESIILTTVGTTNEAALTVKLFMKVSSYYGLSKTEEINSTLSLNIFVSSSFTLTELWYAVFEKLYLFALNISYEDNERIAVEDDHCKDTFNYLYTQESKNKSYYSSHDEKRIDDYYTLEFEHDYYQYKWELCNKSYNASCKIYPNDLMKLKDLFEETAAFKTLRIVFNDLSLVKLDLLQNVKEAVIKIDQDVEMSNEGLKLSDCLDNYLDSEIIPIDQKYKWDKWKNHTAAIKQVSLTECPKYLIIYLKRFENNFTYGIHGLSKNEEFVDYPYEGLEVWYNNEESKAGDCKAKYDLYGVIHHVGTMEEGHYWATWKSPNNLRWYNFNDSLVREIYDASSIVSKSAYVLWYERKDSN